jgi:hypothetical protein
VFEPLGITTRSHCSPHKVEVQTDELRCLILVPGCRVPSAATLTKETSRDLGLAPKDLATEETLERAYHLTPVLYQKAARLFGLSAFHSEELFVLEFSEGAIENEPTHTRRMSFGSASTPARDATPRRGMSLQPTSDPRRRRGASRASLGRSPAPDTTPILTIPRLPSVSAKGRKRTSSIASIADDVPEGLAPSPSQRLVSFNEPPETPKRYALRSLAESPAESTSEAAAEASAEASEASSVKKGKMPAMESPATPRRVTRSMAEDEDEDGDKDVEDEEDGEDEEDEEDEEAANDTESSEPTDDTEDEAMQEEAPASASPSTSTPRRRKRKHTADPETDEETEIATPGPSTRSSKRRAVEPDPAPEVVEYDGEAAPPAGRLSRWVGKFFRR